VQSLFEVRNHLGFVELLKDVFYQLVHSKAVAIAERCQKRADAAFVWVLEKEFPHLIILLDQVLREFGVVGHWLMGFEEGQSLGQSHLPKPPTPLFWRMSSCN
jgi:hypothetical protein